MLNAVSTLFFAALAIGFVLYCAASGIPGWAWPGLILGGVVAVTGIIAVLRSPSVRP
ncbi:MAG: hypothetical protein QM680_06565 [Luteolibacter sp.]